MNRAILSFLQISLITAGYWCATGYKTLAQAKTTLSNKSSSIQTQNHNLTKNTEPRFLLAQISTDGTVDTIVTPGDNQTEITGGETRGSNLFHSFQDFSVPTNNEAFFNNAQSINNIFSRVTGGNISNIDGAIRANGSANLFLINPVGIIFGQNARLDIGGSFYGSTADSILFPDGEFSAVNNLDAPTLTINAPIGLGLRDNPQPIVNRASSNVDGSFRLQVDSGQNFTLVGGNINFDGAIAAAPSGRIELGGLSSSGVVSFNEDLSLSFPENIVRADINFTNDSFISVASEVGGSIDLNARNINLTAGSSIVGGLIATEIDVLDAQAGDININATETVTLDALNASTGTNTIFNNVESGAVGNGGDINITANNLAIINGGQIQTLVRRANTSSELASGEGIAGNINLDVVETIAVSGFNEITNADGLNNIFPSLISSELDVGATGASGNITIAAGSLEISNGGLISSSTLGDGDGGNITLDIAGDINLDRNNLGIEQFIGEISSTVESGAVGNGGRIDIQAQNLALSNGASIQTIVRQGNTQLELAPGEGIAGDINIIVSEAIEISAIASDTINTDELNNNILSFISSSLDLGATGTSGAISISAGSLEISNGGLISSSTFGNGDAGNITLNIAGDINLSANAEGVFVGGVSDITSNVESGAVGNGGEIDIRASNLFLTNGGQITSIVREGNIQEEIPPGEGIAGDINIDVEEAVRVSGISETVEINGLDNNFPSAVSSSLDVEATGASGAISISADSLEVSNGGLIFSSTFGNGNAGNITLDIAGDINLDGARETLDDSIFVGVFSGIFSTVESGAVGNAGEIDIRGKNLVLTNGGQIQTSVVSIVPPFQPDPGEGIAGNINIDVEDTITISGISNTVRIEELTFSRPSFISSVLGSGATGASGNIAIAADSLTLDGGGVIVSSTVGRGNAGDITLRINEDLTLNGVGEIFDLGNLEQIDSSIISTVESGGVGNGGTIDIEARNLSLTNGSEIETIVRGEDLDSQLPPGNGIAGNIFINVEENINLSGLAEVSIADEPDPDVFSQINSSLDLGATGQGGNIFVTAGNSISLSDRAELNSSSLGEGNAGEVTVESESLNLDNSAAINASTVFGEGGIVNLQIAEDIILKNNSTISARAFERANGGNLDIDARFIVAFPNQIEGDGSDIVANAVSGNGGNIAIDAEGIFGIEESPLNFGTNDIDASSEQGARFDGNISINLTNVDALRGTTELPTNIVNLEQTNAQTCQANRESAAKNSFNILGKGGVPAPPIEALDTSIILFKNQVVQAQSINSKAIVTSKGTVRPARGIKVTESGEVILTAYRTNNAGDRVPDRSANCGV